MIPEHLIERHLDPFDDGPHPLEYRRMALFEKVDAWPESIRLLELVRDHFGLEGDDGTLEVCRNIKDLLVSPMGFALVEVQLPETSPVFLSVNLSGGAVTVLRRA